MYNINNGEVRMKQIINLVLMTVVISVVFLLADNSINWGLYLFIQVVLMLFLINNAARKHNFYIFKNISIINFVLFTILCIKNYQINRSKFFTNINDEKYFIAVLLISSLAMFLTIVRLSNDITFKDEALGDLYDKRKNDLERLIHYVKNFEIVGLNGDWGTGKSYLTAHLKKNIEEEFYFIEIDLLTCNLDNIQAYLINRFEHLLYSQNIIPRFSDNISTNFKDIPILNKFNLLLNLVFRRSNFYSTILMEFQNEVSKLDKKVLVIYEDIDRINNNEKIKELFAISEKIACPNIHFLYEYDESKLVDLGFSHNYLEKYIPLKLNLTQLEFIDLIRIELKKIQSSNLRIEMFDFIRILQFRNNFLLNHFEFLNNFRLNFAFISIRKTKNLIRELELVYDLKEDLFKINSDTVIGFFMIKHFLPEIYNKFDMSTNLLDIKIFELDNKSYSLHQLMQLELNLESNVELISKIFDNEKNQLTACCIELLGIEIIGPIKSNNQVHIDNIATRSSYKNTQISRIIRHLSYAGTSELNDYDYAVKRVCSEVLNHDDFNNQKDAFLRYWEDMFNSHSNLLDNTTIFKLGNPPFEDLFKAFAISNAPEDKINKLIDFYIRYTNNKELDLKELNTLNKIPFKKQKSFFEVLNYFNHLTIVGNFNRNKSFFIFINKYISSFSQLSIVDISHDFNRIDINDNIEYQKEIDFLKYSLEKSIMKIETCANSFDSNIFTDMKNHFLTIKTFLLKIIEIINYPTPFNPPNPVNITYTGSKTINHDEYIRLKQLRNELDLDSLYQEINESYNSNKLSLYEFTKLLQEIQPIEK